jgi:hypothetical protein
MITTSLFVPLSPQSTTLPIYVLLVLQLMYLRQPWVLICRLHGHVEIWFGLYSNHPNLQMHSITTEFLVKAPRAKVNKDHTGIFRTQRHVNEFSDCFLYRIVLEKQPIANTRTLSATWLILPSCSMSSTRTSNSHLFYSPNQIIKSLKDSIRGWLWEPAKYAEPRIDHEAQKKSYSRNPSQYWIHLHSHLQRSLKSKYHMFMLSSLMDPSFWIK